MDRMFQNTINGPNVPEPHLNKFISSWEYCLVVELGLLWMLISADGPTRLTESWKLYGNHFILFSLLMPRKTVPSHTKWPIIIDISVGYDWRCIRSYSFSCKCILKVYLYIFKEVLWPPFFGVKNHIIKWMKVRPGYVTMKGSADYFTGTKASILMTPMSHMRFHLLR